MKVFKLKALVFNCSPHMDRGNIALILDPYVKGMKEGLIDVYLEKMNVDFKKALSRKA